MMARASSLHPDFADWKGPRRTAPPRGFVLVGVIMMVLALTILGLSLFSLSSYEAQFMNRSLDEQQALQYAAGGLDRARFALSLAPDSLIQTKRIQNDHITYAVATQIKAGVLDTAGVYIIGGNPISVRVVAEYRGVSRTAEADFMPVSNENYYKRLLTIVQGIIVKPSVANPIPPFVPTLLPLCGSTQLGNLASPGTGRIWEGNAVADSITWQACVGSGNYVPGIRCETAPAIPAVSGPGGFIATHLTGASSPYKGGSAPAPDYQLWWNPGEVHYWATNPSTAVSPNFSLAEGAATPTISVRGRAVWLLPRGMRFEHMVRIVANADPNACLVIVAGLGQDPYTGTGNWTDPSIWFFDGIQSDIPLILVSDQRVLIERFYGFLNIYPDYADNISIFARNIFVGGPVTGALGRQLRLNYGSAMDAQIDELMARGALPNAASPEPLALKPGTWRVSN